MVLAWLPPGCCACAAVVPAAAAHPCCLASPVPQPSVCSSQRHSHLRPVPAPLRAAQPNGPTPAAVRRAALDLVEEAAAVPPVPPFVDYDPLLADIQQWVEDLEGAGEDVAAEQRVAAAATTATAAQLAAADRAADPEGHYRLSWLRRVRLHVGRVGCVGLLVGRVGSVGLHVGRVGSVGLHVGRVGSVGLRPWGSVGLRAPAGRQGWQPACLTRYTWWCFCMHACMHGTWHCGAFL